MATKAASYSGEKIPVGWQDEKTLMAMMPTHLLINCPKLPPPLKQALIDRGLTVVENDWQPKPDLLRQVLACIVDFGGSVKSPIKAMRFRRWLSRYGVPIFSWNRDAPHNNNLKPWRLGLFDLLRPLDIYATHSLIDTRWRFADAVLFLPNAADVSAYNLRGNPEVILARLRDGGKYRCDISFFGALDGARYKEARDREAFFAALAQRLDALNISHRFVDTTQVALSLGEQIELIQSSRINLNFGARCDFGGFPPSGLPERCFGIPACGGFLLTDRRIHTADSFVVGKHLDEFATLDECVEKIRRYLADFPLSRNIAEAGWRHVMSRHTYADRAQEIHQALLEWHAGKRGQLGSTKTRTAG